MKTENSGILFQFKPSGDQIFTLWQIDCLKLSNTVLKHLGIIRYTVPLCPQILDVDPIRESWHWYIVGTGRIRKIFFRLNMIPQIKAAVDVLVVHINT